MLHVHLFVSGCHNSVTVSRALHFGIIANAYCTKMQKPTQRLNLKLAYELRRQILSNLDYWTRRFRGVPTIRRQFEFPLYERAYSSGNLINGILIRLIKAIRMLVRTNLSNPTVRGYCLRVLLYKSFVEGYFRINLIQVRTPPPIYVHSRIREPGQ